MPVINKLEITIQGKEQDEIDIENRKIILAS